MQSVHKEFCTNTSRIKRSTNAKKNIKMQTRSQSSQKCNSLQTNAVTVRVCEKRE